MRKDYAWAASCRSPTIGPIPELDKFERRILALLQLDARISSELIAAEVGPWATAVQRRIKIASSSDGKPA